MPDDEELEGRPPPVSGQPGWYLTLGAHDQAYWDGESWSAHRHLVDGEWVEGSEPLAPGQLADSTEVPDPAAPSSAAATTGAAATKPSRRHRRAERRERARSWLAGLIWLLVVGLVVAGVAVGINRLLSASHHAKPQKPVAALYVVTGTNLAIVTWSTPGGDSRSPLMILPWEQGFTTTGPFTYRLSATPITNSTATCAIFVGGRVVSTQTSNHPGRTARCTARAPSG